MNTDMKIQRYSISILFAGLLMISSACKQETIEGAEATGNEPFKVYFLNGEDKGVINGIQDTKMEIDVAARTANFPVPVFRGGQAGSEPFTVDIAVDNSAVSPLIQSGDLPANTVVLDAGAFTLAPKDTLMVEHDMMKGNAVLKVKIESLGQYAGKNVAVGLKIAGTSRYSINESMNKVVLYFNVSSVAGLVGFPSSASNNGKINLLSAGYTVNRTAGTVDLPVAVEREGSANLGTFTVDVQTDNSAVTDLMQSGKLPANTVALTANDYTLETKVSLSKLGNVITGNALPRIKIAQLNQYSGKKAAIGLKLANPSQFAVDPAKGRTVVYFDVDSLLDEVVPPTNLLVHSAWQVLNISAGVTFTVNSNGSILAEGGSWGHAGVFQPIQVKANKNYKIDMRVAGSGAADTWLEVYVGATVPSQGAEYNDGGNRMGLNTWSGCGNTPFNGMLSTIKCSGSSNIVKFSTSGTVYLVIRSGGGNLGTGGISISDIDFRRVD
ncbi:hypothetical protein DDR33_22865 [Pararcticibacter amylolyticus]|uniref:DUF1735 domain-containing protein n=2 Tax=Pararcticibacter amylolyticus TaxID=2173175 RepID=A0A2U2PB25_9SPHI|nr:hypothetical protein DDR33_22865 [Pararcticibacter amylolyticus]